MRDITFRAPVLGAALLAVLSVARPANAAPYPAYWPMYQDVLDCNRPAKNPQAAAEACRRLLVEPTVPGKEGVYVNLGTAHQNLHEWEDALTAFSAAIALKPNDPVALLGRANANIALFHLGPAIADLTAILAIDPKNLAALANRCTVRGEAAVDLDAALADCDAALAIEPRAAAPLSGERGMIYLRQNKYDEAIAAYDAAINGGVKSAYFYFGRAVAKARKGNKAGSDADVAAALALNQDIKAAFATYGLMP